MDIVEINQVRDQEYYAHFRDYQAMVSGLADWQTDPTKVIDCSLLDMFAKEDLSQIQNSYLLMLLLLEIGNTIDAVTIGSRVLAKYAPESSLPQNFTPFLQWKKRKCHCCMEFILDSGKAVTCVNLIKEKNPCTNLYCSKCVINFMEEKHNYEEEDAPLAGKDRIQSEHQPNSTHIPSVKQTPLPEVGEAQVTLSEEEKKVQLEKERTVQKEKEVKKVRSKLWLKAIENVLFVCPCCQGYCLIDNSKASQTREFSKFSICNFNERIINHPRSFLNRDIYWYRAFGCRRSFVLAKISGLNKEKALHKVEVLSTSQTCSVKLQKEELFFLKTVREDTKLFQIIDKQGFELDIKSQIDKQIKNLSIEPFTILEKYQLFLETTNFQDFVIPKFQVTQGSIRGTFLAEQRDLFKRFDTQLFMKTASDLGALQDKKAPEEEQENQDQIRRLQELKRLEAATNCRVRPPERDVAMGSNNRADAHSNDGSSVSKQKSSSQEPSVGVSKSTRRVREVSKKSFQNYRDLNDRGYDRQHSQSHSHSDFDKPFGIERARHQAGKAKKPLEHFDEGGEHSAAPDSGPGQARRVQSLKDLMFPQSCENIGTQMTREKNAELAQKCSDNSQNVKLLVGKDVFRVEKIEKGKSVHEGAKYENEDAKMAASGQQPGTEGESDQVDIEGSIGGDADKEQSQSEHIRVPGQERMENGRGSPGKRASDSFDAEYMKALYELPDRKEYNLRRNANSRGAAGNFNEKELQRKQGLIRSYNKLGGKRMQENVADGFYDDFPAEIIKEFGLKVSGKAPDGSASNKRQKTEPTEVKKESDQAQIKATVQAIQQEAASKLSAPTEQPKPPQAVGPVKEEAVQAPVAENGTSKPSGSRMVIRNIRNEELKSNRTLEENDSSKKTHTDVSGSGRTIGLVQTRRFKKTPELEQHHKRIQNIAINSPEELLKLFIFVHNKEKDTWRRAKLLQYIQPPKCEDADKRLFLAQFEDKNQTQGRINLLDQMFIVDCNYGTGQEAQKDESEQNKSVEKLLNNPHFNSKKRVKKLLQKRKEYDAKSQVLAQPQKPQSPPLNEPNDLEEQKQVEQAPNEDMKGPENEGMPESKVAGQSAEAPQAEVQEPARPPEQPERVRCEPLQAEPVHPQAGLVTEDKNEALKQTSLPSKVRSKPELKEAWIENMHQRLISKKKDSKHSNQKGSLLEFYVMNIQDELADSSDEEMELQAQPIEPPKEAGQQTQQLNDLMSQFNQQQQLMKEQLQQQPQAVVPGGFFEHPQPFADYPCDIQAQYIDQQQQQNGLFPYFENGLPVEIVNQQQGLPPQSCMDQIGQQLLGVSFQGQPQQIRDKKYVLIDVEQQYLEIDQQKQKLLEIHAQLDSISQKDGQRPEIEQEKKSTLAQIRQWDVMHRLISSIRSAGVVPESGLPNAADKSKELEMQNQENVPKLQEAPFPEGYPDESQKQRAQWNMMVPQCVGDNGEGERPDMMMIPQPVNQLPLYQQFNQFSIQQQFQRLQQIQLQQQCMQQQLVQMQTHSQSNEKGDSGSQIAEEANKEVKQIQVDYLRQVQGLLDKIDMLSKGSSDLKQQELAFKEIEEEMELLEQGYRQEAFIEEQLCEQMEIQDASECGVRSESDLGSKMQIALEPQNEKSIENENSKIPPDFFHKHIDYLTLTREHMEPRPSTVKNNLEKHQVNPLARLRQRYRKFDGQAASLLSKERLDDILDRFYKRMITYGDYKRCKCPACFKMVHPMLIKYYLDSMTYLEEHHSRQFSNSQMLKDGEPTTIKQLLQSVFCQRKSDAQLQQDLQLQQHFLKQRQERAARSSAEGHSDVLFDKLVAVQAQEFEQFDREPIEQEVVLPKISKVMVKEESARNEGRSLDTLQKLHGECEDKLKAMVAREEQRGAKGLDPIVAGRQVRLEFDLHKTMQKLLLQLKLLEAMPRTQGSAHTFKHIESKLAQRRIPQATMAPPDPQQAPQAQAYPLQPQQPDQFLDCPPYLMMANDQIQPGLQIYNNY